MMSPQLRMWCAYYRQYCWFYVWKWTRPLPRLHRLTIGPVNHARQDYIEAWRKVTK